MKMDSLLYLLLVVDLIVNYSNGNRTENLCIYAKDECPQTDIEFWLYRNESKKQAIRLDPLNLLEEMFRPRKPLIILIHGFGLNKDLTPNREIRPVLLQHENVSVISIDYSIYAKNPCYYPWAVKNAFVVAKCTALLINNLIDLDYQQSDDIHLIGFSLGAQIAGLTANHLKRKLKRITALDPARPGFITSTLDEMLDKTDAEFIDVIHTDPALYSFLMALGHVDFYPNLYELKQAGCPSWPRPHFCNHFRAAAYYAESIYTKVGFWSYQCSNWYYYLTGQCHLDPHQVQPPVLMGYHVPHSASGSYFLNTAEQQPYALGLLRSNIFELPITSNLTNEILLYGI